MHDLESSYSRIKDSMSDSHTDDTSKRQSYQAHLQKLQTSGEHVSNLLQVCVAAVRVHTIHLDDAVLSICTECCCLQYVSLNVRGIRKVLNKFDRISSPQKPKEGCMALQVERPHHAGSTTFQVGVQSTPLVGCLIAVLWHRFT